MIQENQTEFIERYLMGKLSLWELAEIEEQIKTDSAFAEDVSFQRDLLIGIRESRRMEIKEKLSKIKARPKILRLRIDKATVIRYSIAASISILVITSLFFQNINSAMATASKGAHYSSR